MKASELAGYLLENPDWKVDFSFIQMPDEIDDVYIRTFDIVDVGDSTEEKTVILIGDEND